MKTTLLFLSVFLSASLFGQNVYIPDANFKNYLLSHTDAFGVIDINTNGDSEIQVSEASVFNGLMDCSGFGISDMTGIEAFTALTELFCFTNQLTSLDVSQNTALIDLYCWDNQLTTLNVNGASALTILNCRENQLTNLDLSQNTALRRLVCSDNPLTSLDVSQNISLTGLDCENTEITSLDLSQNFSLSQNSNATSYIYVGYNPQLTCLNVANGSNLFINSFEAQQNSSLFCIQVDDAEWATANWTNIDAQTAYSEDCNNDCTSSLNELSTSKNLIQILDLMGRETSFKPDTPLIYVYDDGSIEKVFTIE